jgi:hypothetical protein
LVQNWASANSKVALDLVVPPFIDAGLAQPFKTRSEERCAE